MNTTTSPRLYGRTNAARAEADRLAHQGHHVHYAADGYTTCLTAHCTTGAAMNTPGPRRLTLPDLYTAPCTTCGAVPGQPCTSHGGTRTRTHDVHQARTKAHRKNGAQQ